MGVFGLFVGLLAIGLGYLVLDQNLPLIPSPDFRVVHSEQAPHLMKILHDHEREIGEDLPAYTNHCLRTLSYAKEFLRMDGWTDARIEEASPLMEAALAYHDIALWTHGALNYLDPSADLAAKELLGSYSSTHIDAIRAMITEHHKVTKYTGPHEEVVNAVRKGDWLDFTQGVGFPLRSGMPRGNVAKCNSELPNKGFHDALQAFPAKLGETAFKGNMEVMKIYKW